MGEAIGAKTIDLEWVQVHPTGLVKPDDPDAKIKFLAAEALRGVGGIILNKEGERFANELGRRDYVTGEMWKNKPPFRLCLNKAASDEIIWHCKHYTGRGVMKFYESGKALAADMGVPVEKIAAVHEQHYGAAKKQEKDPEGGQYPAYPSGKTHDEPSGKTGSGKKFFHNIIPGSQFADEPFYVAIITPVIHYCMGGLEIDANSLVISKATGKVIPGLYAAGEVAGGVHGNNRLGGNSLLDCVVFGRVSGRHATEYILGKANCVPTDLKALSSGQAVPAIVAKGKMEYRCEQVIVVGGGLAGVSACNTILENGGKTLLVDKSSFCGGNSTKATSGINGAATRTQRSKNIEDSKELFTSDTLKGGAKKPEIVKVLCENSGADVEWLMDAFNLDLSLVARLGGHSAPRTHRGKERFPGMTITYALIQMVEKVSESCDRARITTKSCANTLLMNGSTCVGLTYRKGGADFNEYGPVILASGGFGADFTSNSLLAQYRPDLMHLPTTNGEHCTGDGIKMGEAIGAKTIDLEWVQVHPTGLVKPDDPDAKIKFLAAEALRGVGGIILNKEGERFANELGRRDYVTGEMWKNKPPFRLCLNKAASDEIIWHCKHYTGRGVMKFYESGKALAADMGVPVEKIAAVHEQHYGAAKKQEKDPEGGQYPAYPSGKTHDEPSGKTGSGKKFFHNIIPGSQFADEPFYVAIITPVIHYCMGGLEIDANSVVLAKDTGKPIQGLYAAGEVAGGVHGNNRLGGNSLLDCVVFGRVSGKHACEWILGGDVKATDLKSLSKGGLSGEVKASKFSGGSYEDNMNESKGGAAGGGAAPAASGGVKGYSMDEVAKHTTEQDCWVVVNGEVLDVTNFLSSHPGGVLAIVTFAGKDATEEFNMIHPPDVIPKYAPDAIIGVVGAGVPASGGGGGAAMPALPAGQSYYPMSEVAKHTTEKDCWVVVGGNVLNVTSFLSEHPGGALAILTFAGKDATEEFDMIHPPDVIGKYAPNAIIGKVGEAPAGAAAAPAAAKAAPARKDLGGLHANHQAWGQDGSANWRIDAYDDNPGVFIINVKSYCYATIHLWIAIILEVLKTIFCNKNFKINATDRIGLTRSAILLILFIVIHAVGNLHVFAGPDDFNGYGYFYVRLYWTGFGLPANIVEEYILLSALLHVTAGLAKTWNRIGVKGSIRDGNLNLGITGVILLIFMTIHLFQFRFGATKDYFLRPPPYFIFFGGITKLQLFWTTDESITPVKVRDIYRLEFDRFLGPSDGEENYMWAYYYIFSTVVFVIHASLGWQKVITNPAMGIPKGHHTNVRRLGWLIFVALGLIYIFFPVYVLMSGRDVMCGKSTKEGHPMDSLNTGDNAYKVCQ